MNLTDKQKNTLNEVHLAFSKRLVRARLVPRTDGQCHVSVETCTGLFEVEILADGSLQSPRLTSHLPGFEVTSD